MRLHITGTLRIDLATERWECRACGLPLGSARDNYKAGLVMQWGGPQDLPVDPGGPCAELCLLYEYFCPGCGTRIEAERQPPGHLPSHDIELDIDLLQRRWADGGHGAGAPPGRAP